MNTCKVTCSNNGKTVLADILQKSDKAMRVALHGSTLTINLSRIDTRRPYVGHQAGLEFTSDGS